MTFIVRSLNEVLCHVSGDDVCGFVHIIFLIFAPWTKNAFEYLYLMQRHRSLANTISC